VALDSKALFDAMSEAIEEKGFESSKYSKMAELLEVIAEAVVLHIVEQAEVTVTSGSSMGAYRVI
jgi:aspartate/methionine/tyrosine aminotransferase